MKLSSQSGFQALNRSRLILSLFLILLIVCNAAGQIRDIEISRYVQPSRAIKPIVSRYFSRHFRFSGGVVPWGTAEFLSPAGLKLGARQLQLVILDKAKLRNDQPDYDAIGIRWNGKIYKLSAQDDLIYPLMKFIQRGSYIAYTIPVVDFDEDYFQENALVSDGLGSYVAQEFASVTHAEFLSEVDLDTETEEIPADIKARIISEVNQGKEQASSRIGTYVNADFHVKYKVFLDIVNGDTTAEVGGLPLRYFWRVASNDSAIIRNVQVFKFPEEKFDLQYRAILFFQTAAILRQFSLTNKREFNRFLKEVGVAVGRR